MILLLDTSTPFCKLTLVDAAWHYSNEWEANRTLANNLLGYLKEQLSLHDKTWSDLSGIVVMQGPGSFTGLRIGMTVLNTLSYTLDIPIVAQRGEQWQSDGLARIKNGDNDKIALPFYGAAANITTPRK